jgi:hypothetical protein
VTARRRAGAYPDRVGDGAVTLDGDLLDDDAVLPPSRFDPVARNASAVVGGPAGRRLGKARGLLTAIPVLVVLSSLVLGAGVVQKQHCRAEGWSTPDQFWHACYSDIAVLYGSVPLHGGGRPTLTGAVADGGVGQPPLASVLIWAVSGLGLGNGRSGPAHFFDTSALVLGLLLMVGVALLGAVNRRRPWDAAHLALSPVLVVSALISYQLLALTLVAGALLAWSRRRALPAGVLLGLAVLSAPQTAVLLVALPVVGLRLGRGGDALRAAATAGLVWLGTRLLLFTGFGGGLSDAWQSYKAAGAGYGSFWLVPQLLEGNRPRWAHWWFGAHPLSGPVVTTLSLLALLALVGGVATVALTARVEPRLGPVALAMTCAVLLSAKALPPQSGLLLLPLVAVAGLRWRDHLIWATTEICYFVAVWLYIAAQSDPNRGMPGGLYLVLLLARLTGIGWLGFQAVRAVLDPDSDPGRPAADPEADPELDPEVEPATGDAGDLERRDRFGPRPEVELGPVG